MTSSITFFDYVFYDVNPLKIKLSKRKRLYSACKLPHLVIYYDG